MCKPEVKFISSGQSYTPWHPRYHNLHCSFIPSNTEELHNIGLAFVWRNQQECNWKEMLRLVKERCNDTERQNILAKFPDKSSLTQYRELNVSWGKKLYIEFCSRKERSGIAWLIAGIWQLKGVRRNADKGRCPLRFEREDVKHIYWNVRKQNIGEKN